MTRQEIIRGPAAAVYNGATLFSADDIDNDLVIDTFTPPSSMHGSLNERVSNRMAKVRLTPVGEWKSLAIMNPYASTLIGSSIFGAADLPLDILSLGGQKISYKAAALTTLPEIYMGAKRTAFGSMEFTCLLANGVGVQTANSLVTIAAQAFADLTWQQFDITKVVTEAPAITWSTGVPTTFKCVDGVTISFNLSIEPVEVDEDGIVDYTLADVGVMAKFTPVGITEADLLTHLKLQGPDAPKRGASLGASGYDLLVENSLGSVTIKQAAIKTAGYRFGKTVLRHGEIGLVGVRSFTSGKSVPLWTLA
jgi:hypothetical protein